MFIRKLLKRKDQINMTISDITRCIRNAHKRIFYRNTKLSGIARFLLMTHTPLKGEKVIFQHDSKDDSFNWRYDKNDKKHFITSTEKIHNVVNVKTKNSLALTTNFMKEVYRHELGHALYTERDSDILIQELKKFNIPFNLFNLFEDCFIEFKIVKDFPQFGKFFWHRYIDILDEAHTASEALYSLKLKEAMIRMHNSKSGNLTRFLPDVKFNSGLKEKVIYISNTQRKSEINSRLAITKYYREYCESDNIYLKADILNRWVLTFGSDVPHHYEGQNKVQGYQDQEKPKQSQIGNSNSDKGITSNIDYDNIENRGFGITEGERSLTNRIFSSLRPICKKAYSIRNAISTSGSRLYIKNAITRLENAFRSYRKTGSKLKMICFVDFSGSMRQTIMHLGGKEFLGALKLLSDRNIIDLKMIISFNEHNYDITNDSLSKIMEIEPCGSHENFDNNLKKYDSELKDQDLVLLFTDGYLTGNIPNEENYRRRGINLIASCICEKEYISKIRSYCDQYFTKSFIDSSPISLAKRLLEYSLKKV